MSENLRAPLDHACGLARQGVRVFPCKNIPADPAQHKAPLTIRGFRDASTDAAVIRAWWQCWREALVGAVAEKFCASLQVQSCVPFAVVHACVVLCAESGLSSYSVIGADAEIR